MTLRIITYSLIAALLAGCGSAQQESVAPVYDDNTAFVLVGQEIPAGRVDYYLFDFDGDLTVEENAQEVMGGFRNNSLDARYMAMVGPDPAHNLAVLTRVVEQQPVVETTDLVFIYVGPAAQRAQVRRLTTGMDLSLRYVVYP